MIKIIKRIVLFFVTTQNHSFMLKHGYLPKKIGTSKGYSNGICAWSYNFVKEMPIWELKKSINKQLKMFENEPIRFKLINQYRAWGYHDTELIETTNAEAIAIEYERLFNEHMKSFDFPTPCIHIFKGDARIGVFSGIAVNKEYIINELLSM